MFAVLVLAWKFAKQTKIVKLEEMDIWSGRREYGDDITEDVSKKTVWTKIKDIIVG